MVKFQGGKSILAKMFIRLQFKCLTKHNNTILLGNSQPLLRHLLSQLLF